MKFISNSKSLFFFSFIFLYVTNSFYAAAYTESVTNRKLFFTEAYQDWERYVGKEVLYKDNKSGLKCLSSPPKYILKSEYNSLIKKLSSNDKFLISKYYGEDSKYFIMKELTDMKIIKQIDKIFEGIEFNKRDYIMFFYNINSGDKKISYFGSIYYRFDHTKELVESKVFYHNSGLSYLQFDITKENKFDVYLFGKLYRKNLNYYFPLDSLKYISFSSINSLLAENRISEEILITKEDSVIKNKFIDKVITPSLNPNYYEDGALNQFGEYVNISNGKIQTSKSPGINCSGFVKEITDNLIRLKNPKFKRLTIEECKEKRNEERKNNSYVAYEEDLDPFFGIDWTKNLADRINYHYDYKIIKAEAVNKDKYSQYFEENGYYFKDMQEIIFRDQQKDSSYFYFVVFNKLRNTKPTIPTFYHIAVVVPIFTANKFELKIYESGIETGYINILKRMIPQNISYNRFNKDIINKLTNQDEIALVKRAFTLKNYSYHINNSLTDNEISRIRNIFDNIDFEKEKGAIFKIPIPVNYIIN